MKTIETKVYTFDELSDSAKEKARDWLRYSDSDYAWTGEWRDTLKAFESLFPVRVKDWSVDYNGGSVQWDFTGDDDKRELKGSKLISYLWNHYSDSLYQGKYYGKLVPHEVTKEHPAGLEHKKRYSRTLLEHKSLTGYCADEDIMRPLWDVMDGKDMQSTFEDVLGKCFDSWASAWAKDMEYQTSDEYIEDNIRANDYTFTAEGKRFG